jgi:UPF0042 nucleotide-binding protein
MIQKTDTVAAPVQTPPRLRRITLISFGFKYGQPPANYYFDVSFLTNPARQPQWDLFSQPCDQMRQFVLEQPTARAFLDAVVPLLQVLIEADDDVRVAFGCSSGRHRSCIIAEQIKARIENDHTQVRLVHREEPYA